jgi:hypothetical protein
VAILGFLSGSFYIITLTNKSSRNKHASSSPYKERPR